MSKEMVVASNRHELRVAIVEDEQLVEIYYQRAQEYSLAGSIHKGRVTRVLPGMQSAFVDIGLERDAFLYVSDFFEENEEFDDRAPSGRNGRQERAAAPPPPPAPALAAAEPEAAAPSAAPASAESSLGDRDRRGRRSRRRRGKSRGFPESKYASSDATGETEPEPPAVTAEEPSRSAAEEDDFSILPGESLRKYHRGASDDVPGETPENEDSPEEEAAEVARAIAEAVEEMEAEEAEEAEEAPAPEEQPEEEAEPEAFEEAVPAELLAEAEAVSEEESEEDEQAPEEEIPAEVVDATDAAETPVEPVEDEGPEPARIPTSLTATLREQGKSYLQRVSRRNRRRGRGAPPAEERTAEPPAAEPAAETRSAPVPRGESRKPERQERERPPQPQISDLLKEGQEIIVQIAKEPIGQKGARITSYVALPGRYVVYMPTVEHVGVSRKIGSDEERDRLKRILHTHRAGISGGFIMRTAGEGRTEQELRDDMHFLYNLWLDIRQKAEKRKAPALMHQDLDVVQRVLRDQLTPQFKNIWVDSEEVYANVVGFVERFQPSLVNRVRLYTRSTPIFDAFNITSELEKALRPKVWLKSGGYIVINQTEALVAIDINTGKFVGKSNRLEDTIVKTNTDAIKEIVRQIRLRDLGGIIVVDFIDMDERKNRQKVMQVLEEAMRADRAPYKILQFNDFGLVAITRKRVKQSLERTLCSPCPYCEGAGYVKSEQTVIGEIIEEAHKMAKAVDTPDVMLRVSPGVAKILKSHETSYLEELEEILGRPVLVKSDPVLHQEKFDLG
ncbi:MAG: Rne/Rng family ribonuclease [Bryobacterales bacterium]|nr:Rne/Rng family ribonuclease [Bryobacterales bacterium]